MKARTIFEIIAFLSVIAIAAGVCNKYEKENTALKQNVAAKAFSQACNEARDLAQQLHNMSQKVINS